MCLDSYGLLLFPTDCLHSAPLQKSYSQLRDITTKHMKPLELRRYLLPHKSAQTNANGVSHYYKSALPWCHSSLCPCPRPLSITVCVAEKNPECLPDLPAPTSQVLGLQAAWLPQLQLCSPLPMIANLHLNLTRFRIT